MLSACENAMKGTRIISRSDDWPALPKSPPFTTTLVSMAAESTALDAARPLIQRGKRVAIVNAASAHHVGGGFTSGGRHALEEAFCVQSTLYQSLQRACQEATQCTTKGCSRPTWNGARGQTCCRTCPRSSGSSHGPECDKRCSRSGDKAVPRHSYIPADGAVLSPSIEIFRTSTLDGYETLPQPLELACVASVSMPNLNSKVRDAPVSKYSTAEEYRTAICQRWRAALRVACIAGASDLICPDVGCGVYANDSKIVARALAVVLRMDYWRFVEQVWLVGNSTFCEAVMEALGSECGGVACSSVSPREVPNSMKQSRQCAGSSSKKLLSEEPRASGATEKEAVEIDDVSRKRAFPQCETSVTGEKKSRKWLPGQLRISSFFGQGTQS